MNQTNKTSTPAILGNISRPLNLLGDPIIDLSNDKHMTFTCSKQTTLPMCEWTLLSLTSLSTRGPTGIDTHPPTCALSAALTATSGPSISLFLGQCASFDSFLSNPILIGAFKYPATIRTTSKINFSMPPPFNPWDTFAPPLVIDPT